MYICVPVSAKPQLFYFGATPSQSSIKSIKVSPSKVLGLPKPVSSHLDSAETSPSQVSSLVRACLKWFQVYQDKSNSSLVKESVN